MPKVITSAIKILKIILALLKTLKKKTQNLSFLQNDNFQQNIKARSTCFSDLF